MHRSKKILNSNTAILYITGTIAVEGCYWALTQGHGPKIRLYDICGPHSSDSLTAHSSQRILRRRMTPPCPRLGSWLHWQKPRPKFAGKSMPVSQRWNLHAPPSTGWLHRLPKRRSRKMHSQQALTAANHWGRILVDLQLKRKALKSHQVTTCAEPIGREMPKVASRCDSWRFLMVGSPAAH